jgi:hypothetical protein
MVEIPIRTYKCPRCGKTYEDSGRGHFSGKLCKECTELIMKINQMERRLLAEEFSLEQKDEKIAERINDELIKESAFILKTDQEVTPALLEQLIKDEKRRKKILKEILKLQRWKR